MQSKDEYLLRIGLHNWVYKRDEEMSQGLYTYPYSKRDILILQQIECRNNILKLYFRCIETDNIKNKDEYKDYIFKLRKDLKDTFNIWPNKYDKHISDDNIIDIMMYKLTEKQLANIYILLRIQGYISSKDEAQAFDFTI